MPPFGMDRFGPAASLAVISSSGAADVSLMIPQVKSANRKANDQIFMTEGARRAWECQAAAKPGSARGRTWPLGISLKIRWWAGFAGKLRRRRLGTSFRD